MFANRSITSVMAARIRKTCSMPLPVSWILRMKVLPRIVSVMAVVRRKKKKNSIYDWGGVVRRNVIEPVNDIMMLKITKDRMIFGCICPTFYLFKFLLKNSSLCISIFFRFLNAVAYDPNK